MAVLAVSIASKARKGLGVRTPIRVHSRPVKWSYQFSSHGKGAGFGIQLGITWTASFARMAEHGRAWPR